MKGISPCEVTGLGTATEELTAPSEEGACDETSFIKLSFATERRRQAHAMERLTAFHTHLEQTEIFGTG
jgi:hypothetical protein